MLKAIQQNLTTVISEVLETMFFVLLEPQVGKFPKTSDFLGAQVEITGPNSNYEIELLAQTGLLNQIAADFLSLEDGCVSDEQSQDVLKEIVNMVVGNLVNICDPEAVFKLGIPKISGVALNVAKLDDCVEKYIYSADDGVFVVGVRKF